MNNTLRELIHLCKNEYIKRELELLCEQLENVQCSLDTADKLTSGLSDTPEAEALWQAQSIISEILEGSKD